MANKTASALIASDEQLHAEVARVANELSAEDLLHFRTVTDWLSEEEMSSLPPQAVEAFFAVVRLTHPLLSRLAIVLE